MLISIFTPTYNRGGLLKRVYDSLLLQAEKDFEWIVVDDGSTDDTEQVMQGFITKNLITIRYFKQKNGGKHRAINKGVSLAEGKLFFIVDSDDYLPENALGTVVSYYRKIRKNAKIAAIAGRRTYKTNTIVGNSNFEELISNSIDIRYKYNVTGDLVEVFKTEVLRKFPFPEFENEKFCPEVLVWNRIAQEYDILFFNKGIYFTEYIAGGLTANIVKIRMQAPQCAMICYSELATCNIGLIQNVKANINFWRFSFNSDDSFFNRMKMVSRITSFLGFPVGLLMYLKDKIDHQ